MARQLQQVCMMVAIALTACAPVVVAPIKREPPPTRAPKSDIPSATPGNAGTLSPDSAKPSPALLPKNSTFGRVLVPASLVSNNGGSLISNNGGSVIGNNGSSIISNNGGNYRLLALEQVPLAGAVVRVIDAAGKAVVDDAGQAIVATTDENGYFAIQSPLPDRHVVLQADLPGQSGSLQAFAMRDARATQAVELELVSSLTTGYILERYVRSQADPLTTIEKLPASIEAQTRLSAKTTLEASATLAPKNLSATTMLETVEQMRTSNQAFDAQMEVVKKLLVVAGLSNLGDGEDATEVFLGRIRQIIPAPDDSLYIAAQAFWRVTPQRKLQRLEIGGMKDSAAVIGGFDSEGQIALDPSGRLWHISATGGLVRRNPDGSLTSMTGAMKRPGAFAIGKTGTVYVREGLGIWKGSENEPPTPWFEGPWPGKSRLTDQMSVDNRGNLVLTGGFPPIEAWRLDTVSRQLTEIPRPAGVNPYARVSSDARGYVYFYDNGQVHRVDENAQRLAIGDWSQYTLASAFDGTLVGFDTYPGREIKGVYTLKNGQATLLAGKTETTVTPATTPDKVALSDPIQLVVMPDGVLYVIDNQQLIEIRQGKAAKTSNAFPGTNGLPAAMAVGADGLLYFSVNETGATKLPRPEGIYRLNADGTVTKIHQVDTGGVQEIRSDAGGRVFVLTNSWSSPLEPPQSACNEITGDGTVKTLWEKSEFFNDFRWLTGDRLEFLKVVYTTAGQPSTNESWLWEPGKDWQKGAVGQPWPQAIDGQGRLITTGGSVFDTTLVREDPRTGTKEILVGPGGKFFNGSTPDDGVKNPFRPGYDAEGNLYFIDRGNKQIKRVSADLLQ